MVLTIREAFDKELPMKRKSDPFKVAAEMEKIVKEGSSTLKSSYQQYQSQFINQNQMRALESIVFELISHLQIKVDSVGEMLEKFLKENKPSENKTKKLKYIKSKR